MFEPVSHRNYYTLRFAVSIKKWNVFKKAIGKEDQLQLLSREYDGRDDFFIVDIGVPLYEDEYSKKAKKLFDKFNFNGKVQKK